MNSATTGEAEAREGPPKDDLINVSRELKLLDKLSRAYYFLCFLFMYHTSFVLCQKFIFFMIIFLEKLYRLTA